MWYFLFIKNLGGLNEKMVRLFNCIYWVCDTSIFSSMYIEAQ